jgi:replicative DNA helicase
MRAIAYEAEVSVLGAIFLTGASALAECEGAGLEAQAFGESRHRLVYLAAQKLVVAGTPIDPITVLAELGAQAGAAGGMDYLLELSTAVASAEAVAHHAAVVLQAAQVRHLIRGLDKVTGKAKRNDYDGLQSLLDDVGTVIQGLRQGRSAETVGHRALLKEGILAAHEAYKNPGVVSGVPTGFLALDAALGGLQPGALCVLAARPAMGKTALAMQVALNAAKKGHRVLFFSLEMPRRELALRVLACEAMVDGERIRSGHLRDQDLDRLMQAVARDPASLPIEWCDKAAMAVSSVRVEAQRMASEPGGLSLIAVDYLQLVMGKGQSTRNREQEVAEISRGFKLLAKEFNVPVLLLSQLNRGVETRANKRPLLSDLRESGAIEQDADVVMFVYRDEYYNETSEARGKAEVIVAKNRNGSTGTRLLKFQKAWTRFDDVEQGQGAASWA